MKDADRLKVTIERPTIESEEQYNALLEKAERHLNTIARAIGRQIAREHVKAWDAERRKRNEHEDKGAPRPAIHPGEILAGELRELGVSAAELARCLRIPVNHLSQIIHGKRSITGDTALRLGHWFGNSPRFWLSLQIAYDLRLAEEKAGREIARLPVRPRLAADAAPDAQ